VVRLLSFACIALLTLSIAFAWMWRASERRFNRFASEVHRAEDIPVEQRAIALKARFEHVPVQKIADLTLPVTIHFPDRRCVELRPPRASPEEPTFTASKYQVSG
jgi:hypothetical protein